MRARAEIQAERGRAAADQRLPLGNLRGSGAVLARRILGDGLARGRQARVQLEGLQVQFHRHRVGDTIDSLFQRMQADRTPRAGDVGDEVEPHQNISAGSSVTAAAPSTTLWRRPGTRVSTCSA